MSTAIALPMNSMMGIGLPDERQLYSEDITRKSPLIYERPDTKLSSAAGIISKYLASEVLKRFPSTGKSVFGTLVDTFVKETQNSLYNQAMTELGKRFPTIAHQIAWWEGSSKIESYYTAKVGGKEMPLYIKSEGEPDVDAGSLSQHYEQVTKDPIRNSSALNGRLLELFNRNWSKFYRADERYMNGDIKNVENYDKFWIGFSKLDLYHIRKSGKKVKMGEFVDSGGRRVELLRYERPPRLSTYFHNWWGNLQYDIKDIIFYNIVRPFGPVATHAFIEAEWKNHVQGYKMAADPSSMHDGHFT